MEFTKKEIQLLVSLLEAEKQKESHTLNFFHAEIKSAHKKLSSILDNVKQAEKALNESSCANCGAVTNLDELEANGGICNHCHSTINA